MIECHVAATHKLTVGNTKATVCHARQYRTCLKLFYQHCISGIMLGTVAVIILAAVLIIVVKRNRRLPAVATTGSNPQTPTHVSFSTNVDNPPEIKLHRRKIIGKISLLASQINLTIQNYLKITNNVKHWRQQDRVGLSAYHES
jgi:hypothetical protein